MEQFSHVELEFKKLKFHRSRFDDGEGEKEKKRRKRRFGSKEEEEDLEKTRSKEDGGRNAEIARGFGKEHFGKTATKEGEVEVRVGDEEESDLEFGVFGGEVGECVGGVGERGSKVEKGEVIELVGEKDWDGKVTNKTGSEEEEDLDVDGRKRNSSLKDLSSRRIFDPPCALPIHPKRGGKQAKKVKALARRLLEDFSAALEAALHHQDTPPSTVRWIPPPIGWYKVNTDGAVFTKYKSAGIGVIARDEQGRVVAAMSKKLELPLGPVEAEAKAMETAATFATDNGLQDVIFEGDSSMVCSALQGDSEASPAIANIIAGTLQHLQRIPQAAFRHTKRVGNKAAHGLAKYAKCINDFVTRMEETPHMIYSEVMSDLNQT